MVIEGEISAASRMPAHAIGNDPSEVRERDELTDRDDPDDPRDLDDPRELNDFDD